jgi:hypothetical protein
MMYGRKGLEPLAMSCVRQVQQIGHGWSGVVHSGH